MLGKRELLTSLLLLLVNLSASSAINAYLYYQDAYCTDSNNIAGTIKVSFDSWYLSAYSYSKTDYSGACLYLEGGSLDISSAYSYYMSSSSSTSNSDIHYEKYVSHGYCIQCNGVTGCSSDNTCDTFSTSTPSNKYSLSMGGEDDDADLKALNKNFAYQFTSFVQQNITGYEQHSSARYVMMGAFLGVVSLFSLLGILEGLRVLRNRNASTQFQEGFLSNEFSLNDGIVV